MSGCMDLIDKTKKIVVIGTVFLDIKGYPEGTFDPAGRNAGRIEYKYGGVARNVADDLAGLGMRPVFVSMTDDSGPGAAILDDLNAAGVDTEYVMRGKDSIGTWMVILDLNGEVCANLSRRQDLRPLLGILKERGDEIFRDADGVLLEMDVEEEIVAEVFRLADRYQTDVYGVISNMNIALERLPYISRTACFVCNRQEAGILFGKETLNRSPAELLPLIREGMREKKIRTMVVTMDKDGAVYVGNEEGHCPAQPVEVADSTGAGDAFFSGVSAAMISGLSLTDACRIGTEMAADVISSRENIYRSFS